MIYLLPLLFLALFVVVSEYLKQPNKLESSIIYFIFLLYYTTLVALRYRVGIDTLNYMESYSMVGSLDKIAQSGVTTNFEPLYIGLCLICRSISEEFVVLQIVHVVIINILITRFIFRNTRYRLTALLLYLIMGFLYFNTEIIRESIAVALFINAIELLKNRKYLYYYAIMIIASGFHTSALITLFVPFFMQIRFNKLFFCLLALFITLLYLFTYGKVALPLIGGSYSVAMDKVIGYLQADSLNLNWIIVNMVRSVALPALFLTLYNKIAAQGDEFRYSNMILLYIIVGFGMLFIQIIFARIGNYFLFFYVLLLTELFHKLKESRFRWMNSTLLSLLLLAHGQYYFRSTDNIVIGTRQYTQWYPYSSIFDKRVDSQREKMWNR
ncbi:MAG: EpsG family protein [Rikenellaceae bacterium]